MGGAGEDEWKRGGERAEPKERVHLRTLSSEHPAASAKWSPWKKYKSTLSQADAHSCTYSFTQTLTTCKYRHPQKQQPMKGTNITEEPRRDDRYKSVILHKQLANAHFVLWLLQNREFMSYSTGGRSWYQTSDPGMLKCHARLLSPNTHSNTLFSSSFQLASLWSHFLVALPETHGHFLQFLPLSAQLSRGVNYRQTKRTGHWHIL